jgi:hypothetical protein
MPLSTMLSGMQNAVGFVRMVTSFGLLPPGYPLGQLPYSFIMLGVIPGTNTMTPPIFLRNRGPYYHCPAHTLTQIITMSQHRFLLRFHQDIQKWQQISRRTLQIQRKGQSEHQPTNTLTGIVSLNTNYEMGFYTAWWNLLRTLAHSGDYINAYAIQATLLPQSPCRTLCSVSYLG